MKTKHFNQRMRITSYLGCLLVLFFSCKKHQSEPEKELRIINKSQTHYTNPGSPGVAPVDISHLSANGSSNYSASWAGLILQFTSLSSPAPSGLTILKFKYNGREYSAVQAYCNNISFAGSTNAVIEETGPVLTINQSYCATAPSGPTTEPPSICKEWRTRIISARIVLIFENQQGMSSGLALVPTSFFVGTAEPIGPWQPD